MIAAEPLIVASGVTRVLSGAVPVTLVRNVDLGVRSGELVAITASRFSASIKFGSS